MTWLSLFLIFLLLVTLDKGLTAFNIHSSNKNFPEATKEDPYKIEKNPLAKWFFVKLGLFGGTIVYGMVSILTLFLALSALKIAFGESVSLYIIFMIYGFVIFNNLYFSFKFTGVIP
jgi:hypothetical protein